MVKPLVFLFQLIFGQWDALWESCWRGKSFFLALTVSFISMPRVHCCLQLLFFVFFYLLSINLPSSLWTQTSCGFALQSQAFLKGRCINREKWGMNWSDDKRLNYLGSCIQYLRWLWFTGLCVLWDLLSRKELLTFRVSVCWFSDVTRWYDKSNPAGWLNFALRNSP